MIPDTDLLAGTSIEEPQMQQSASSSPFPTLFLTSNKGPSSTRVWLYTPGRAYHYTSRPAPRGHLVRWSFRNLNFSTNAARRRFRYAPCPLRARTQTELESYPLWYHRHRRLRAGNDIPIEKKYLDPRAAANGTCLRF